MTAKLPLPSTLEKVDNADSEFPKVKIVGYTGNSVSLRGYPYYIDEPVVYNVKGIRLKDALPYFEDHSTLLGHTESNVLNGTNIETVAVHSDPDEYTNKVFQRIENGIPYQASMGLDITPDDEVIYVTEGKVTVNNREFTAPVLVVNSSELSEMTTTLKGRDPDTSTQKLSKDYEEGKELVMAIKNSTLQGKVSNTVNPPKGKGTTNPAKATDAEGKVPDKKATEKVPEKVANNSSPPKEKPEPKSDPPQTITVKNNDDGTITITPAGVKVENTPQPVATPAEDTMWLFDYIDYPEVVKNARKEKWSQEKVDTEVAKLEAVKIENSYKGVPGIHIVDKNVDNSYLARTAYALGVDLDFIKNKVGEKAADYADKQGPMGLTEGLMLCANSNGGVKYNGHSQSDITNMCKDLKGMFVQNSFSTIDYPNIMHKVADWKLEERWTLEPPQSPELCKTVNSTDFRTSGHLKPRGGKQWDRINDEGKITHGAFGKEDTYTTDLDTVAQMLTFQRQDIINDDMGWIEDTMDAMLEGALMIPDKQWVNLFYGTTAIPTALAVTLALSEANLSTMYNLVRRRTTVKTSSAGDVNVSGRFNTRWNLLVGPDLEETAWNIIKQDRIVNDTTANTKTGDKNYWFNRLDIKVFDNLDNDAYHASATGNTWGLLPKKDTFLPFYIRYLNRQTRPTTETVDMPADMLGFGIRGFWDVNLGERPVENNELQAIVRSIVA